MVHILPRKSSLTLLFLCELDTEIRSQSWAEPGRTGVSTRSTRLTRTESTTPQGGRPRPSGGDSSRS